MEINEEDLIWTEDRIEHIISKHNIRPEEIMQTLYDDYYLQRTRDNSYQLIGKTSGGRYLFVVLAPKGNGKYKVITSRDATQNEKRKYRGA